MSISSLRRSTVLLLLANSIRSTLLYRLLLLLLLLLPLLPLLAAWVLLLPCVCSSIPILAYCKPSTLCTPLLLS